MSMATLRAVLSRIEDVEGRTFYMSVKLVDDAKAGFHLLLSDGRRAWSASANAADMHDSCLKTNMGHEEFLLETRRALTRHDGERSHFRYQLKETAGVAVFSWKKYVASEDISFQLGSLELVEDPNACTRLLLDGAVESECYLAAKIKSLKTENLCLSTSLEETLKKFEQCVRAKEEMEVDLLSKFALVLNSKKSKIRELKQNLTETIANEMPTLEGRNQPALDEATNSMLAVDICQSNSDYETDREEMTPAKRSRPVAGERSTSAAGDSSLILDDDVDTSCRVKATAVTHRHQPKQKKQQQRSAEKTTETAQRRESKDKPGKRKNRSTRTVSSPTVRTSRSRLQSTLDVDDLLVEL